MGDKDQKTNESPKKELDVKVKHLIEYLQKFDGEISVNVDKDGWMENWLGAINEVDLIGKRGIFDLWSNDGISYLTINN